MSERREFKIGDRVRIRDWDDMVREFGEPDSDGDIKIVVPYNIHNTESQYITWFIQEMRILCGRVATIDGIDFKYRGVISGYKLRPLEVRNFDTSQYTWISEMLIPLDDPSSAPDVKIRFEEMFG